VIYVVQWKEEQLEIARGAHFIDYSPLAGAYNYIGIALLVAMSVQSLAITRQRPLWLPAVVAMVGAFVVGMFWMVGAGGVFAAGFFGIWCASIGLRAAWRRFSGNHQDRSQVHEM
jgi:hypothetical protein